MAHLYKITSPSGKSYIGVTDRAIKVRYADHVYSAKTGSPYAVHAAIRKYGSEAMLVESLFESDNFERLLNLEVEQIRAQNTLHPYGYNLTRGGEGHTVVEQPETVKQKISEGLRRAHAEGRFVRTPAITDEARYRQGAGGRALRGKQKPQRTKEHSAAISAAKKGKVTISEQVKEQISSKLKGRIFTEQHRANLRAAWEIRKSKSLQ